MNICPETASHMTAGAVMAHLNTNVRHTTEENHPQRCVAARSRRIAALLAALLVLTGCSNPDPAAEPEEPSNPNETAVPDEPGDNNDREPADEVPGSEELAAIWEAFHAAWVEQAAVDNPDPAAFEELAAEPDGAVEALLAQRGDSRLVTTEAELWPRFNVDGGRAEVSDCAIVAQHPDGQPDSLSTITIGWEATAVVTEDGWRIEDARQLDLFCIAEELNDELLAAYREFREAKNAAWDPPDPDHPDLERTMAGEQLEFIRELLAEHQREGIVVRDPAPVDQAVVFELGIGEATVSDCAEQVPERGAFDLETGERLDDLIPPIREGQFDLQSVELERGGDGAWRVVDQAGTRDTNCVPGSTRYVVS